MFYFCIYSGIYFNNNVKMKIETLEKRLIDEYLVSNTYFIINICSILGEVHNTTYIDYNRYTRKESEGYRAGCFVLLISIIFYIGAVCTHSSMVLPVIPAST